MSVHNARARAINTNNATPASGHSSFAGGGPTTVDWTLSQAQWGNFTYYFCALGLPVVCVAGIIENALSIWVLVAVGPRGGIGPTSRLYYMALAALELGNLLVYYLVNLFGDYGLHFITNGAFYWVWETSPHTAWVCHLFKACFFYFPHIINWTYLLLNVERFCAVTFPLHTKQWFSVHSNIYYLSIFAITGIPVFDSIRLRLCVSVFGGFVYNVVRSHAMPNYSYACAADTNEGNWWIAYRVFIAADLYIGPNMASLAVAVLLFMRIRFELVSRAVLLHVTHSEAGSARPLSLGQISGALTAVVMAVAHATFYLPGGVLGIVYYQVKSNGTEAASEPKLWMLYTFSLAVSSVGSCTDFFIYFVRIPAFRAFLLCRSPTAAAFKEIEL